MKLTRQQVELAVSDTQQVQKVQKQIPTWKDLKAELGEAIQISQPDANGSVTARVSGDAEALEKYNGMMEPWREAEVEIGQERDHRDPDVAVKDGSGVRRHVKQSTAAQAEQKFRKQYDASGKGRRGRGW